MWCRWDAPTGTIRIIRSRCGKEMSCLIPCAGEHGCWAAIARRASSEVAVFGVRRNTASQKMLSQACSGELHAVKQIHLTDPHIRRGGESSWMLCIRVMLRHPSVLPFNLRKEGCFRPAVRSPGVFRGGGLEQPRPSWFRRMRTGASAGGSVSLPCPRSRSRSILRCGAGGTPPPARSA